MDFIIKNNKLIPSNRDLYITKKLQSLSDDYGLAVTKEEISIQLDKVLSGEEPINIIGLMIEHDIVNDK